MSIPTRFYNASYLDANTDEIFYILRLSKESKKLVGDIKDLILQKKNVDSPTIEVFFELARVDVMS